MSQSGKNFQTEMMDRESTRMLCVMPLTGYKEATKIQTLLDTGTLRSMRVENVWPLRVITRGLITLQARRRNPSYRYRGRNTAVSECMP